MLIALLLICVCAQNMFAKRLPNVCLVQDMSIMYAFHNCIPFARKHHL